MAKRYVGESSPIFRIKPLNDKALNQEATLKQEDKRLITSQIIQKNKDQNEMLCKCLAAIFEVDYENEKIPMEYVHSHHSPGLGRQALGKNNENDFKPDKKKRRRKRPFNRMRKLFNRLRSESNDTSGDN